MPETVGHYPEEKGDVCFTDSQFDLRSAVTNSCGLP